MKKCDIALDKNEVEEKQNDAAGKKRKRRRVLNWSSRKKHTNNKKFESGDLSARHCKHCTTVQGAYSVTWKRLDFNNNCVSSNEDTMVQIEQDPPSDINSKSSKCTKTAENKKDEPFEAPVVTSMLDQSKTSVKTNNLLVCGQCKRTFSYTIAYHSHVKKHLRTSQSVKNYCKLDSSIHALKPAIIKNVPSLKPAIIKNVPSLKPAIIKNVPSLKPAIIKNVPCVKPAIVENVPLCKPTIVENVPSVKTSIVENVPFCKCTIVENVPSVKPSIVENVPFCKPTIVENVPNVKPTIVENVPLCKPTIVENAPSGKPAIVEKYFCKNCQATFEDLTVYKTHIKQYPQMPCLYCNLTFKDRLELDIHIKHTHLICVNCNLKLERLSLVREHLSQHFRNEIYFYECPFCPEKFKCRKLLIKHLNANYDTHNVRFADFNLIRKAVNIEKFYNDKELHKMNVLQCYYCLELIAPEAFDQHLKKSHSVHKCTTCTSNVVVTNLVSNKCNFCDMDYQVPVSFENTILSYPRYQSNVARFMECRYCYDYFNCAKNLKIHEVICTENPTNKLLDLETNEASPKVIKKEIQEDKFEFQGLDNTELNSEISVIKKEIIDLNQTVLNSKVLIKEIQDKSEFQEQVTIKEQLMVGNLHTEIHIKKEKPEIIETLVKINEKSVNSRKNNFKNSVPEPVTNQVQMITAKEGLDTKEPSEIIETLVKINEKSVSSSENNFKNTTSEPEITETFQSIPEPDKVQIIETFELKPILHKTINQDSETSTIPPEKYSNYLFQICEICKKIFHSKESFKTHKKIHRKLDKYLPCLFCKYKFIREDLAYHMEKDHNYCPACNYRFSKARSLKSHQTEHKNGDIFKYFCHNCTFSSFNTSDTETHYKQAHNTDEYSMAQIKKTLYVGPVLTNLELMQQSVFQIQCTYCNSLFTDEMFKSHLLDSHGVSHCEVCKRYSLGECAGVRCKQLD